jgi:hypothetical protein
MLRAGDSIRFTPAEIAEFEKLGIDFDGVRTQADVEAALTQWVGVLSDERPDLLEKIALALVEAEAKGVKPPPRFRIVASSPDCPGRS